ncbi:ThuA domain-containing protein [Herbiconiux sp. 11R-BC]|uniref:ThuA domain-containing protein n=1 Tax=Herbiconiux sp. 11R-BC TaxID=3111637 RepID=UPI003C0F08F8
MTEIVILTGTGAHTDPWHALDATSERVAEVLGEAWADADTDTDTDTDGAELTTVRVTAVTTDDDVAAALDGAGLVIVNVSGDLATEPVDSSAIVDALLAHTGRGGGVVALHSSALAFGDDPRWAELAGGRWVPGVTMHPQIGHALVQAADGEAAAGLTDFVVYDERYTALERDPATEVLAFHTEDGLAHPLVWRRSTASGARVAYDALGHGVESYDSAARCGLLLGLVSWAAGADDGRAGRALGAGGAATAA